MKIKTLKYGHIVDIFAIVWWENGETSFHGIPKGNGGLTMYDPNEVEIIDPHLDGNFIYFSNTGKGIYHRSLIEERLLDDILEYDPVAYQRFITIIKAEGLVDADFY